MTGLISGAALTLAACNTQDPPNIAAVPTRGATVAFASIDGPPLAQFHTLVQDLNKEAQARQIAVTSRKQPSAYRVRGYLAATVDHGKTTIAWVWDVFDRNQQRALRISGSETAKAGAGQGWQVANNSMLQNIADTSMGQLAAFLNSPTVAPAAPQSSGPQIAFAMPGPVTPEAEGIFPISSPKADPIPAPAAAVSAAVPRRRPPSAIAVADGETMTLAAAGR